MTERHELEMSSVEAQLCVLYAEKQRLEEELGSSSTDDILTLIDDLNARIADLEVASDELPGLDETDDLRIQLAQLVAEREAFLLSVDAGSLDEAKGVLDNIRSTNQRPHDSMQDQDFEVENALDDAIDMATDVSSNVNSNGSVQDAFTVAKDLRTMAEQLGDVFSNSKVTFTGRLHGGQWKLECNNG